MLRIFAILLIAALPLLAVGQESYESRYHDLDSLRIVVDRADDSISVYKALQRLVKIDDNVENCLQYSHRMLNIAEHLQDSLKMMRCYQQLGVCYNNFGDNDNGVDYAFKALLIAQRYNDLDIEAQCLFNIASFYSEDQLDEAMDYFVRAIDLSEKLGNYANLENIYYNIAIFYLERDILNMAVENLQMARDAYMKGGNINLSSSTEYNLTIRATKLLYYFQMRDSAQIMSSLDSLNGCIEISRQIVDFAGVANFYIALCDCNLKALDYCPESERDKYLGFARQHLDLLMGVIEYYNVQWLIPESYNTLYARYLMAAGQYKAAGAIINDPENFSNEYEYAKVRYQYYIHEGKYRQALQVADFLKHYSYSLLSIQKAVNYDHIQSKLDYERQMVAIKQEADQRNQEFESAKRLNEILAHHAVIVLVILLLIIGVFLYSHHSNNILKEQLTCSKSDISNHHLLLSKQQEKIVAQTSEILEQSKLIQQQRDDLEETNHYLTHSINVGADIQKAFLYNESQVSDILGKCFVFWKPLHMVSGDFYWTSKIVDREFLLVADCTGHGVPGALLSMYGIAMLNDYVKRNANCNAAGILEIIKAAYLKQFVRGDEFLCDGMDCALIIINREEMTVDYAGARRPLIQIRNGEILEYRPDKISIGNNPMRPNTKFTNKVIDIQHGDMLFAFTDGIADQFGGDDSATKFGNQQLKEILSEISFLDTTIQKTIIASVIDNWRRGPYYAGLSSKEVSQLDDQLLIGVRV